MASLWKYIAVMWRRLFAITPEERYPAVDNSQNATSLPNVVVGTCMITNPNNTITLYPNAGPGEAINISSLPNGIYLFSVVLNGETYSKTFFKL